MSLTVASEKMPWLNVHIALPLAIIAGYFVGQILQTSDLRADLPKVERFAPYMYAVIAAALSVLVFVIVGPFTLASTGAWILAAVAAVAFVWAFSSYSRRTGLQVALVGLIAALMIFTIRAGVLSSLDQADVNAAEASYSPGLSQDDHGALPVELLVYTQTSGDIPILVNKLEQYGRQTGKGVHQPVVVDSVDGFTWPWAWYLRNYTDVQYATITQGYQPPPGSVLFIASQDAPNLNLGDGYNAGVQYHHRRWFPENYRGTNGVYSTHDFFGDLFSGTWWSHTVDYFIRRTPPDTLGTVDGMAFFPKDANVIPAQPVGPTVRTRRRPARGRRPGLGAGPDEPARRRQDRCAGQHLRRRYEQQPHHQVRRRPATSSRRPAASRRAAARRFNQPWSIAVAPDGSVFVADTFNWNIIKLDKDLKQVKSWGEGCTTIPDCDEFHLFGPRDIAVTPDGNVLITDTGNERMIEYTAGRQIREDVGQEVRRDEGRHPGPARLQEPVGLAVALNGDVYVADYWNKRILHFTKDFTPVGRRSACLRGAATPSRTAGTSRCYPTAACWRPTPSTARSSCSPPMAPPPGRMPCRRSTTRPHAPSASRPTARASTSSMAPGVWCARSR